MLEIRKLLQMELVLLKVLLLVHLLLLKHMIVSDRLILQEGEPLSTFAADLKLQGGGAHVIVCVCVRAQTMATICMYVAAVGRA